MSGSKEILTLALEFEWGRPSHLFSPRLEILNNVVRRAREVEHQVTLLSGDLPTDQVREMSWAVSVPGSDKVEREGHPDARGQFRLRGLREGKYSLRVRLNGPAPVATASVIGRVTYKAAAQDLPDDGEVYRFATEDDQTLVGRVITRADRLLLIVEGDPRAIVGRMIRFTIGREGSFQAHGFIGLYDEGSGSKCRGEVVLDGFSPEMESRPVQPFSISARAVTPADLGPEDRPALERSIEAAGNKHSRNRLVEVRAAADAAGPSRVERPGV